MKITLKSLLASIVAIFICFLLTIGYSDVKGEEELACVLKASKNVFNSGENITLLVTVKNYTHKEIYFIDYKQRNAPFGSTMPIITNDQEQKINIIWKISKVYPPLPPTVTAIKIIPDGEWTTKIQLSPDNLRLVQKDVDSFMPPGKYQIKINFNPPALEVCEIKVEELRNPFGLEELKKMNVDFWSGNVQSNAINIKTIK
ncbi:MAG: hypothetical protein ABII88_10650 [Candidatus Omnitrophota bacterium]